MPTVSLAAFAVLLAASAAYGLTAGGSGNVRDLGLAQSKPGAPGTVANATPTPPPAAGTTPAPAPAPAPPATATPPPSAPQPANAAKPKATPKPAATTPSTSTPAPASTGSATQTTRHHHTTNHTQTHRHNRHAQAVPSWFADGDPPYDATVYDASGAGASEHPSQAPRAIDGKTKTAWTTGDHPGGLGSSGVGLMVDTGAAQPYTGVGILTSTPGFSVSVYSSNDNTGSGDPAANGWKLEGRKSNVGKAQRISLKGANDQPRYLLLWITKLPAGKSRAGISEISLLL